MFSDLNMMLLFAALAIIAVFLILCFILCMVCLGRVQSIKKKTANVMTEDIMLEYMDKIRGVNVGNGSIDPNAFCKSAVINFNAFEDVTGEYSFSVALLNSMNSGIILTSLYGRSSCNTYIRQIVNGECKTYLLDEEKEALEKAINM